MSLDATITMLLDQLNHICLTETLQEPRHAEEAIIINKALISVHGILLVNSRKRTLSGNAVHVHRTFQSHN
jgi:hypothetical protein